MIFSLPGFFCVLHNNYPFMLFSGPHLGINLLFSKDPVSCYIINLFLKVIFSHFS